MRITTANPGSSIGSVPDVEDLLDVILLEIVSKEITQSGAFGRT